MLGRNHGTVGWTVRGLAGGARGGTKGRSAQAIGLPITNKTLHTRHTLHTRQMAWEMAHMLLELLKISMDTNTIATALWLSSRPCL